MNKPVRSPALRLAAGLSIAGLIGSIAISPAMAEPRQDLGRLSDYIKKVEQSNQGEILKDRFLVQVSGAPTVDGGSSSAARSTQQKVRKAAKSAGIDLLVNKSYKSLWNGMAVTTSTEEAAALESIPGVTAVFPVVSVEEPVLKGSQSDTASAIQMTGASIAQNELGYSGEGIRVGIIDTGIDIDHPDFGGNGVNGTTPFPNKKIVAGYDLVGDDYDASAEDGGATPKPDARPDDCAGHGTHVSGIVSADGNTAKKGVRGVAPKAQLAAYRVFGCEGSSSTDVILEAMERSLADRMDVINMSLGEAFMTWPSYPDAVAADKLTKKGVIVVTSHGNSGQYGVFSSGTPGVGHNTISVASFESNIITAPAFTIDPGGIRIGYSNATGSPMAATSGSAPLVSAGPVGKPESLGCDATGIAPVPAGSAVLVSRGECSFREKALNAEKAGAVAMVLYNNQPGTVSPTVEGDPPITIPVVMILQSDGQKIQDLLQSQKVVLTFTDQTVEMDNPQGGQISDFSSYGLAADLTLKPDLGAPGGNIWSTYPLEKGGHASLSGTSMASPHVAGAVALLLEAQPCLKGKWRQVRELLQNTANSDNVWSLNTALGLPELVIRQGAGLLQIDNAILTNQSISPGKVELGESQRGPKRVRFTLKNSSRRAITYSIENITSIGTLGTSDPAFDLLEGQLIAPRTIKVPARGKVKFNVAMSAPVGAPNGYIYGGWLKLTAGGAQTLTVPYAGMAGDYQSVPIFDNPLTGGVLPALGQLVDGDVTPVGATPGYTFTMAEDDLPYLMFHLEYPVSNLKVDVYTVTEYGTRGKLLGNNFTLGKYGRDPSYLTLPWDGTYSTGRGKKARSIEAKPGQYILQLRALKPMAKPNRARNWVTWDSPAFTIGDAPAAYDVRTDGTGALQVRSER